MTEPYAEITRVGRFTYQIQLHAGIITWSGTWRRWGRRRAERAALRFLARLRVEQQRRAETWRVEG